MMRDAPAGIFFVLGAVVGSFLNAVIYRLPRGIRLDKPRRSFCPDCKTQIPWHQNVPILSWILLRGKCARCGAPISVRYLVVEALTAVVFLYLWLKFGFPLALAYAVFVSLSIVATFIDLEHYIIPDEITVGGVAAGVALSFALPQLMGTTIWWKAGLLSLFAASFGYGLLWLVVELGKLAFGRHRIAFDTQETFEFFREDDRVGLRIGGEDWLLDEIFGRESDELVIEGAAIEINGKPFGGDTIRFRWNQLVAGNETLELNRLHSARGMVRSAVIPREAMGFGDVKFLACIGAFLGWQAVLFTLFAASVFGVFIGGGARLIARDGLFGRIPFGPYLALGAFVWVVCGPETLDWYMGLFHRDAGLAPPAVFRMQTIGLFV